MVPSQGRNDINYSRGRPQKETCTAKNKSEER